MKLKQTSTTVFLLSVLLGFAQLLSAKATHKSLEDLSLSATFSATEASCGLCNGAIDLQVIGGQSPFSFNWDNGATSEDLEDLCLGVYNVTITDNTGCTFTSNAFVGNNNLNEVILESQAEVDDFVAQFGDCTSINGTLRIGTTFTSGPSDINDISGLSNLTSIGGSLFIFQNPNLNSLVGLNNIDNIGSSLHLNTNNSLTSLSGLGDFTELGGALIIDNHADLLLLDGIENITSVGGRVYISNNTSLLDLSALSLLETIGGDLDIRITPDLTNLTGLEQLSSIGEDLIIRDNFILSDISALDHPITIGGDLTIENTALSNCDVLPICFLIQTSAITTISNNNPGCDTEEEVELSCGGGILLFTVDATNISCNGLCDGSITILPEGGIPPYDFVWSTGETSMTINNLCTDNYQVTITDATGLTAETSIEIMQPFPLAISSSQSSPACFGECNGAVDIIVQGGTEPYSFEVPTELCAGDYTITITDNKNCSAIHTFSISGSMAIDFTVDQITNTSMGQNDGSIETTTLGGTPPFTYSWMMNGTEVSTQNNPTDLAAGDYTVFITDAVGCTIPYGPYTVGITTSTTDISENLINVFPNPASDQLTISFEGGNELAANYSIWSASGALQMSGSLSANGEHQLSTNNLANGLYLLRVEMEEETLIKKVIISK